MRSRIQLSIRTVEALFYTNVSCDAQTLKSNTASTAKSKKKKETRTESQMKANMTELQKTRTVTMVVVRFRALVGHQPRNCPKTVQNLVHLPGTHGVLTKMKGHSISAIQILYKVIQCCTLQSSQPSKVNGPKVTRICCFDKHDEATAQRIVEYRVVFQ